MSSPLHPFHVGLSHAGRGRRQVGTSGGPVESAADDVCGHARAAFDALEGKTMQVAERMAFGDTEILKERVCEATGKGMLSEVDGKKLVEMAEKAELAGVPPLVRIGTTGFFAVRESEGRTVEHRWAHVKKDDSQETRLMCKVTCSYISQLHSIAEPKYLTTSKCAQTQYDMRAIDTLARYLDIPERYICA